VDGVSERLGISHEEVFEMRTFWGKSLIKNSAFRVGSRGKVSGYHPKTGLGIAGGKGTSIEKIATAMALFWMAAFVISGLAWLWSWLF
jgi:hypothetical protein